MHIIIYNERLVFIANLILSDQEYLPLSIDVIAWWNIMYIRFQILDGTCSLENFDLSSNWRGSDNFALINTGKSSPSGFFIPGWNVISFWIQLECVTFVIRGRKKFRNYSLIDNVKQKSRQCWPSIINRKIATSIKSLGTLI